MRGFKIRSHSVSSPRFALMRNAPSRFTGSQAQSSLGSLSLGIAFMIPPPNSASMFLQWCGIPSPLLARMSRAFAQASPPDCLPVSPSFAGESRGDNPSSKTKQHHTMIISNETIQTGLEIFCFLIVPALSCLVVILGASMRD